eukprot:CAMPEP_0201687998 /NCGR_PEP_ID=MMETSP0578-20130828/1799_1 /ASSEMBLY_ACC=CAM_ASM_000663 /TAXON_ID=267565 /ORGANISM="Skeletonema grethea, Strain CCMP 1804" /LENGTH=215 /DNA_ID=CAMNT_0048172187 /DNA_START=73 /DNA_END=720 /DNA_ORIENTATION=-
MSPTILLSLQLSLLLLFHSTLIQGWTPRLSASHSSSGRFFHAHNSNSGGGMKSLRATENNNQEDDVINASDGNDDDGCTNNINDKDKKKKKQRNKSLENEYLVARLESLYDASAAAASSSSSLLESLTEDYHDQVSSSSSPGQSLLYGEENVVVLGDWMEWEEGGSCLGDYCGDESEQCDIPEHYKEFKGAPKVDVMSFLGIKRAEPIHVQRDWD